MLQIATKFKPKIEAFETAEAAGFRHAEFWLDASWLSRWHSVVSRAREFRLQVALHFPNRGELSETTLRKAVALYRELDCSAMVIHVPMLGRFGRRIAKYDSTLRLGVENHRLSPQEFDKWARRNDWLTLDVEHLWKYTLADAPVDALLEAVDGFLKRFGDKLVHVHLPGYAPGCDEHRPIYCSREMVLPVLSLLADHQYDGFVVSEVNARYQNVHELRMDLLLFERWQVMRHHDRLLRHSRAENAEQGSHAEKGSGPKSAKHPKGHAGSWGLTPFPPVDARTDPTRRTSIDAE